MKKILIAALIVLSLSASMFACSSVSISNEKDKLSYTLKTNYGDVSELNGVKISLKNGIDNTLFWESDVEFSQGEIKSSTDFESFLREKIAEYRNRFISMSSDGAWVLWNMVESDTDNPVKREYEKLRAGEINELEINIKDYREYYPLDISISMPDRDSSWGMNLDDLIDRVEERIPDESKRTLEGFTEEKFSKSEYLLYKIMELYRMPILDDYIIKLRVGTDSRGRVLSNDIVNTPYFWTDYIDGKDRDFFRMMIVGSDGERVELQGTEGKQDIYSIDIKDGEYDADSIRKFYEIGASEEIKDAGLSSDYSEFRMVISEGDEIYLVILDAETGELKQREYICKDEKDMYLDLFSKNGAMTEADSEEFIGISVQDERIIILTKNPEGKYIRSIDVPVSGKDGTDASQLLAGYSQTAYIYKDGKLGICVNYDKYFGDGYDTIHVAIYGKNGLIYFGTIERSLGYAAYANNKGTESCYVKLSLD